MPALGIDGCPTTTFSTADVAPSRRAAYWREALAPTFPGLAIDWLDDAPPDARLRACRVGDLHVSTIQADTPSAVSGQAGSEAPETYHLVLQMEGQTSNRRLGQPSRQHPGDIFLVDPALPFESVCRDSMRLLIWSFPKQLLAPLLGHPAQATTACIDGRRGAGAVLAAFACAMAGEAPGMDRATAAALGAHLASLTAIAIGTQAPGCDRCRLSLRMVRRQQVLAYIESHYRDCDLTADAAAHALGMSRRWLYGLLADRELGFAGRVTQCRIGECHRLLADPGYDHLSISEIAFRCGYSELSTFNRHFRTRYGLAPRDMRRDRRRGDRGPGGAPAQ
ncbi:MAG TPA: AraC family transcriptional regulator [Rhodanobacteraceae bacterium]|nr:AraC family transcriptional regulator [Rhodanobacteraceae bacterium]